LLKIFKRSGELCKKGKGKFKNFYLIVFKKEIFFMKLPKQSWRCVKNELEIFICPQGGEMDRWMDESKT
jgi:hypothetical protein